MDSLRSQESDGPPFVPGGKRKAGGESSSYAAGKAGRGVSLNRRDSLPALNTEHRTNQTQTHSISISSAGAKDETGVV